MKKIRVLLGVLLAAPSLAYALGLGDIRLGSALNQPLVADIELVGAAGEELTQLTATLASREAFNRYGLERLPFLSTLTFKVAKDAAGRDVLQMRSPEPITEPFVTLLVEVAWPRGRLIREYTVLLDPPTFESKTSPAPAIEAPRTGVAESATAGAVVRSAPEEASPAAPLEPAASAPTPAPAFSGPAPSLGGQYKVVRRDTLSLIAERAGAHTPGDLNRLMIATFRANPEAFDGNINRLHKGARLTIPGSDEWQALSAKEMNREVRRQMSEWRGQQAARGGGAEEARLRLVPPKEPAKGAASAAQAAAKAAEAERAAKAAKDAETLRLRIESEKLQQLQQEAAKAKVAAAAAAAAAAAKAAALAPPAVQPPAATVPPPAATAPAAAVPPPATTPKAAAPKAEKGLIDLVTDNLLYVSLAAAAVLVALLVGFNLVRRRRQAADIDQSFRRESASEPDIAPEPAPRGGRTAPARDAIVVEESPERTSEFVAPPPPQRAAAAPAAVTAKGGLDDTLSSETAINLDQADPLAEADFHMAYGLYDQAADIVKLAIEREPGRRDLKLKLLEVYFVWGNRDAFLEVARDLGRSRDQAAAGEWDKVIIMGRQIAADDAMFAGGGALSSAADVDLDLEAGGAQGVDLELLGDVPSDGDGIHLDLGDALAATDGGEETGDVPTLDPERFDLLLGRNRGSGGADATATSRMRQGDSPTVESPAIATQTRLDAPTVESPALRTQTRLDSPTVESPALRTQTRLDSPTIESPALGGARRRADSPTVESPALKPKAEQTIREKLPGAGRSERTPADATAELSLDDLGFELDKLAASSVSLEALSTTEHPSDAPTVLADVNARSKALLESAGSKLDETRESPRLKLPPEERTVRLPIAEPKPPAPAPKAAEPKPAAARPAEPKPAEAKKKPAAPANGAKQQTSETSIVKALDADDLDLDLGELARALENDTVEQRSRDEMHFSTDVFATGVNKRPPGLSDVDLDVGVSLKEQHEPTVTERISVDELSMPELEPVTLSEVGTKLDLARAYMDMGDPDGARSILKEVLTEGSASQKQEAQRLIDTLPG